MARLQSDPPEAVGGVPQNLQQVFRFARYLHFLHDPARVIHNADAGLLDRYVQSAKMVHAALLLLMLEAVTTDLVFTISLKRSTQNLQLSTSWAGRLHHLCPGISDINLFRYCQGVIDLDAGIPDSAFDLGMPEQELDSPEIAGSPVDQGRFCASKRMRPKQPRVQPDASDPLGY